MESRGFLLLALAMSVSNVRAETEQENTADQLSNLMKADEEGAVDQLITFYDEYSKFRKQKDAKKAVSPLMSADSLPDGGADQVLIPGAPDNNFPDPTDPTNGGIFPPDGTWDDTLFPFPGLQAKAGLSDRLALVALYETLNFYGVEHYLKKENTRVDFKIIKSKNGYFSNLTKLDVAYAIREFSRYFTAVLCNDPSYQNFYKAFGQVPAEQIGLRFKYDMAIALMGNSLPKEPNQIVKMGSRWTAFSQILSTTTSIQPSTDSAKDKDYRSWLGIINDIVGVLVKLNKMMCYVDIRPNPTEELKKRVVVQNFLNLEKSLDEKYAPYKADIDKAKKEGQQQQLNTLRAGSLGP